MRLDTENSGPRKPPSGDVSYVADTEELLTGVGIGVAAGVVGLKVKAGVDESTRVETWAVESSTVATGEPEGSTKVKASGVGVPVGRVTGTTKGRPVSAAWTPGGVEGVFIAMGVLAS